MNQKKVKRGLRRIGSPSLTESSQKKLTEMLYQASVADSDLFTKLVERQARKKAAHIAKQESYKAQPPIEYGPWKWERTSQRK